MRLMPVLALLFGVAMVTTAAAQEADDPDVVVTSGESVIRTAPDQAFVTLAAEARSQRPEDARVESARAMTAVREALSSAGIPDAAIRTAAYELRQEFDYVDGRQVSRGFVANQTIEVRVDDLEQVASVIDASVAAGASAVSNIRFDLEARRELERQALQEAVADARARAEAAATGAGRTIARVIRIEDQSGSRPGPPTPVMMRMAADEAAASTPVAPGEIEIVARVQLTAALQ